MGLTQSDYDGMADPGSALEDAAVAAGVSPTLLHGYAEDTPERRAAEFGVKGGGEVPAGSDYRPGSV